VPLLFATMLPCDGEAAAKENTGDSSNIIIPGAIDDNSGYFCASLPTPCKAGLSQISQGASIRDDAALALEALEDGTYFCAPLRTAPPMEDVQSSQGGSARSFEYMTPEPTPRTPPGYCSTLGPRTIHAQRPSSAPSGQPQSSYPPLRADGLEALLGPAVPVLSDQSCLPPRPPPLPPPLAANGSEVAGAGKDFSICRRTGTVIPSIPPMPSAAFVSGNAKSAGAEKSCITPPPYQDRRLQEDAALPRRRPSSAAAATTSFAARRSASRDIPRRRAESSAQDLCYPPTVCSAARHGRYTEVESALLAGFAPNYLDSFGNTLFHIACQNGGRRVAKLLMKHGCDINIQNMKGNTGLHFLFAYGYAEIGEYFIKKGGDELIMNDFGKVARDGIK